MPAGNISAVDRHQRLVKIQELKKDGYKDTEIAEELGMGLTTVKRNLVYLKDIAVSDLTPEDRGKKRAELDIALKEVALEAMEQYRYWRDEKPGSARSFLLLVKDTYMDMAKIFGLDTHKVDNFTQINQLNQYDTPDKVDREVGRKIADAIKRKHEERV